MLPYTLDVIEPHMFTIPIKPILEIISLAH